MYKAITGEQSFDIEFSREGVTKGKINDNSFVLDLIRESKEEMHIIADNMSYNVELLNMDHEKKEVSLKVNGKRYDLSLKDKYDLLLDKLGLDLSATKKINEVKAPMPGLVLRLEVKPGDEVKEGDALIVLEAMKMENVLKSPADGVVASIAVSEGQAVEKNEILIHFE